MLNTVQGGIMNISKLSKIVHLFLLPVILVLGTACDEIDGTTSVKRPFIYNLKPGGPEKEQIPVGQYKTTIEKKKKDLVQIELDGPGDKEYEIKLMVPKNLELPDNGSMSLPAGMTGQPFDVFVRVATTVERSQTYREWQSCRYEVRERYCYIDNQGHQRCEYRYVTRWGNQDVEYYFRETTKDVRVNLGSNNEVEALANFYSLKQWRDKVVTWEGRCY